MYNIYLLYMIIKKICLNIFLEIMNFNDFYKKINIFKER